MCFVCNFRLCPQTLIRVAAPRSTRHNGEQFYSQVSTVNSYLFNKWKSSDTVPTIDTGRFGCIHGERLALYRAVISVIYTNTHKQAHKRWTHTHTHTYTYICMYTHTLQICNMRLLKNSGHLVQLNPRAENKCDVHCLLGCDDVYSGRISPTFRKNLLSPG
jgi:hypothetical protein